MASALEQHASHWGRGGGRGSFRKERTCLHGENAHLDPCRYCGQHINEQASMLGIVARHKVPIHDQTLAQVACDDEPRVEEEHNVQREQKPCM